MNLVSLKKILNYKDLVIFLISKKKIFLNYLFFDKIWILHRIYLQFFYNNLYLKKSILTVTSNFREVKICEIHRDLLRNIEVTT